MVLKIGPRAKSGLPPVLNFYQFLTDFPNYSLSLGIFSDESGLRFSIQLVSLVWFLKTEI